MKTEVVETASFFIGINPLSLSASRLIQLYCQLGSCNISQDSVSTVLDNYHELR